MSLLQPGGAQPDVSDEDAIRMWLDALASGACNESAFLQAMQQRFRSDPEANWEVLSQLDQHFRRGRIAAETFRTVKTALAESALRIVTPAGLSDVVAAPFPPPPPPAPAATPSNPVAALEAETRSIPIARDVVASPRSEHTDAYPRREGSQSLDVIGEPKAGSVLRRRYRLETLIGQGSTGPVFQAVDEYRLESPGSQRLAIKILHPSVVKRAEVLADLRREFQALQHLSHPNIVRVFEFDRDGSLVFFTMELLSGATLSRVLQARKLLPLPSDQALAVIRDVGSALAYAHSRGVVHGDINPRNVFVTGHGDLRLLGFPGYFKGRQNSTALDHDLTLPIAASGYASCQILEGERADARDDVFALACLAYLLLSGEHPLRQKTAIEARDARMTIRRPAHLSHRQWQALREALRWEREARPGDIRQWLTKLDLRGAAPRLQPLSDLLEPPPHKNPRSPWAAVIAVAVVVVLAGAYWVISQRGMLPRLDSASSRETRVAATATPPTVPPTSSAPTSNAVPTMSAPVAAPRTVPSPASSPPSTPPAPAAPAAAAPVTKAPVDTARPAATPPAATPPATVPATTPRAGASPSTSPSAAAGSSKVELAADTVDVPLGEAAAEVSVHRKGSLRGDTSFTWWTESGTAKPGTDFSAVVPQIAHIGDGKSSVILTVPLSNAPHAQPKSFYVVIDQTEGGAALAGRTLTMVTLQTPD